MRNVTFTKTLIKGKIAETMFQNIFESSRKYLVLPLGYEHTNPVIRQFNYIPEINKALKNISDTPDFALINKTSEEVMLVEVKYRTTITPGSLKALAKGICENWSDSYLFLVTPDGFFFDRCSNVVENKAIKPLSADIVDKRKQSQYMDVLHEYISQ